jgi:GTP-binding protein Era
VAVVGRPNVGKSTLVNRLVGQKVAIVSSRPQTTRNLIQGAANGPEWQMVLVDTPGLHRPRTELGERLNRLVHATLPDMDAVIFLLDATGRIGPGDRLIAGRLHEAGSRVVCAVNKIDIARSPQVVEQLAEAGSWDFEAYVPVSALGGEGVEALVSELVSRLPEGPGYFPEGMWTDQPEEFLVAEIVREKFINRLRDELPHSLAVQVQEMHTRADGLMEIRAELIVERDSQKGIVIGEGGSMLSAAGAEARAELEALFATRVYLALRVRIEPNWQRRRALLDRLGF